MNMMMYETEATQGGGLAYREREERATATADASQPSRNNHARGDFLNAVNIC